MSSAMTSHPAVGASAYIASKAAIEKVEKAGGSVKLPQKAEATE